MIRNDEHWLSHLGLRRVPEIKAALFAIGSGLLAFWLLSTLSDVHYAVSADVAFIAILLVTLLIFLLLSGRLNEVSGGGFSAKFQAAANAPAEAAGLAGEDVYEFEKLGQEHLERLVSGIEDGDVVNLRLRLHYGSYKAAELKGYVDRLTGLTPNAFVMVVDQVGRFIAATEAARFAKLPLSHIENFVLAIGKGDQSNLKLCGFRKSAKAKIGIDNRHALEIMQRERTNFVVLLNEDREPKKIATRGEVLEHLILALAR
ncbi:MAG: hypothetical protein ACREHE_01920 [Rhizomicrobium sp.]